MKNDFWEGIKFAAVSLLEEDFLTFIILTWKYWFYRNVKVHEDSPPLDENYYLWAGKFLQEYRIAAAASQQAR